MAVHTIQTTISKSGYAFTALESEDRELEINYQFAVPAGAVELQKALPLDVSKIKSIAIGCKDAGVTIKTNDDVTPSNTVPLVAGQSITWTQQGQGNSSVACFLTVDVVDIFLTNLSATVISNLTIRVLLDSTLP